MAAEQDDQRPQQGRDIRESVDRAQTAINRLDNISKRLAQAGQDPTDSKRYVNALMDVDMAVMDAYNRLRKFLILDADEYWNTKVIAYDRGQAVVLGGKDGETEIDRGELEVVGSLPPPDGEGVAGVRFLEEYEGTVEAQQTTERPRFGDEQVVTNYYPKVLQPDDYRRALRVLDEVRRHLGFTPTPTESTPRTEITRDMIEGVEQWRQKNLPKEYLHGNDTNGT